MSIRVKETLLDSSGKGTVTVPPSRLVSLSGSAVSMTNRGNSFSAGDRLEGAEEFVAGACVISGSASTKAYTFFRF